MPNAEALHALATPQEPPPAQPAAAPATASQPKTDISTVEKLHDLFQRSGGVLSYKQDIEQLLLYDTDEWDLGRLLTPLAGGVAALHCVGAESGTGKSTLAARLVRTLSEDGGEVRVAYHFCKHSDSGRQDAAKIAKSMALQLGELFPAAAKHLLEPPANEEVAELQSAEHGLRLLLGVLEAVHGSMPPGTLRVVLLFDALDEADSPENPTALGNPVLRLVLGLHAAGVPIVVTTRLDPPHIVDLLKARWGREAYEEHSPESFCRRETLINVGELTPEKQRDLELALEQGSVNKTSKILRAVLREAVRYPGYVPRSLEDAYKFIFAATWQESFSDKLIELLQLLAASRVPPSLSALEKMGFKGAIDKRPGDSFLFKVRGWAPLSPLANVWKRQWMRDCYPRRYVRTALWTSSTSRSLTGLFGARASTANLQRGRMPGSTSGRPGWQPAT